ncbi:concanavalin A-like lectin/glucanase domain-containing protein [Tricharina praecox]|uniref:concanavalin A-like lectin/glucanase domain-containing protein n=1 Tax=Tricharina praecox TaxID=43433 RepID=UPI00221FC980|nr:concanavalin A-like lectin/glucanase domain-containing protein [Tricharina praecox]KAI5846817.1 concanavalin A-like lectin/glucanase domain-containing protein [Tricharina praecox]
MRSAFVQLAVLVASASLATAQTWTACNPMEKTCPNDPALAGTYDHVYGGAAPDFTTTAGEDVIKYGGADGAIFRVEKKLDAPTIVSNFYIMWGHLDVTMKAAPGGGVVSSVVLQSDNLDEIDWEWVGSKPDEAQSNYFGKGNTDSYDRGAVHPITSQDDFHTYSFDWTQEKLDWIINGQVVRTLKPADVKGDYYPQTPMQVRMGSWAAGDPGNEEGTIQWSGGPINYKEGPYDMLVKEIKVIDYSTGTAYRFSDKTGSWESIEALGGGKIGAGPQSGSGNAGKLATSSAPTSESTSRPALTKTGVLIPTTNTATKTGVHPIAHLAIIAFGYWIR